MTKTAELKERLGRMRGTTHTPVGGFSNEEWFTKHELIETVLQATQPIVYFDSKKEALEVADRYNLSVEFAH